MIRDVEQDALDEYTAFDGVKVRTELRRIWRGHPHFRYVMREVEVRDIGRSGSIEANDNEYIPGTGKKEWTAKTRLNDVEDFLRVHGPMSQWEIMRRSGIPENSVRRACRISPRVVKASSGKWEAV